MNLPDTRYSLIGRLADADDLEAWNEFVRVYQGAVLRYCRVRGVQDADAADVAQQVLLAVHRAAEDWVPSGHAGSFRAWLFETARRSCLAALRRRAKLPESIPMGADEPICDPEADVEADWQRWAFCAAAQHVQTLVEESTWQAFWLTAVQGFSAADAAQQLGVSIGALYTAKCRVMARIREYVKQLTI